MRFLANTPSKRLLFVLGAFVFGVALGPWVPFSSLMWVFVSIGFLSFFWFLIGVRGSFLGLIILCVTLGLLRFVVSDPVFSSRQTMVVQSESDVVFSGVIEGEVEEKWRNFRWTVTDLEQEGIKKYGKILVSVPYSAPDLLHGDKVELKCRLRKAEPIGDFRYDQQLAARKIIALCSYPRILSFEQGSFSIKRSIFALKEFMLFRMRQALPEPNTSFVFGLLFGGAGLISPDISIDFSRTGLSHILAASGYNVSLFTFVLLGILLKTPLGRRWSFWIVVASLGMYVVLAGGTPAVVRATLMALVVLLAFGVRRKPSLPNLIMLSLAILLCITPRLFWYDIGFQLSFVATAGLVLFADWFMEKCAFLPKTLGIREALAGSLAATFATLPIILWHFGELSIIAPIANLIVLPIIPITMVFTGSWLPVALLYPPLAALINLPVWAFSWGILVVTDLLSSPTFASLKIPHARVFAVVSLMFIIVIIIKKYHRKEMAQTLVQPKV